MLVLMLAFTCTQKILFFLKKKYDLIQVSASVGRWADAIVLRGLCNATPPYHNTRGPHAPANEARRTQTPRFHSRINNQHFNYI